MTNNQIENISTNLLLKHDLLKVPINVDKVASKLNINIVYEKLDDSVSGFLVKKEGKTVIGLNQEHHEVRNRFTISHEVGHFILHVDQPLFIDYYKGSKLYRSNKNVENYKIEKQANSFAAALLMPKKLIKIEIFKLSDNLEYAEKLHSLSLKFKVSTQAMDYRLKFLGHYDYGF